MKVHKDNSTKDRVAAEAFSNVAFENTGFLFIILIEPVKHKRNERLCNLLLDAPKEQQNTKLLILHIPIHASFQE